MDIKHKLGKAILESMIKREKLIFSDINFNISLFLASCVADSRYRVLLTPEQICQGSNVMKALWMEIINTKPMESSTTNVCISEADHTDEFEKELDVLDSGVLENS